MFSPLLVVVDKSGSYKMVVAGSMFRAGGTVLDLSHASTCDEPDSKSIDLGDYHVHDPIGRYLNHSCDPNTLVDGPNKRVIALRDISPGDEVTFNYLESEREIAAPFDCHCASKCCVGRVEKPAPEYGNRCFPVTSLASTG